MTAHEWWKPLLALALLALTGCAGFGEYVERAGDAADSALESADATLCSKRFSLRAYEARYGARWTELVSFCQWDQSPPGPAQ